MSQVNWRTLIPQTVPQNQLPILLCLLAQFEGITALQSGDNILHPSSALTCHTHIPDCLGGWPYTASPPPAVGASGASALTTRCCCVTTLVLWNGGVYNSKIYAQIFHSIHWSGQYMWSSDTQQTKLQYCQCLFPPLINCFKLLLDQIDINRILCFNRSVWHFKSAQAGENNSQMF